MCSYTIMPADQHDKSFPSWPKMATYEPLYKDAEDPIPPEDGYDDPILELTQSFVSDDAEGAIRSSRRMLAGSFHEWMRQTFMEEEAARKIQQFVRPRLPNGSLLSVDKLRGTDTTLSFVTMDMEDDQEDDEDHLQYDVFLWHGSYLGLEFYSCDTTGLPCVEDANGNDSLPGMWNLRQGDYLVSINDYSAHKDSMPFEDVEQILEDGVRPAILRFRRPRITEVRFRSSRSRLSNSRGMSAAKKDMQRCRERLERSLCYVVWREEDGPLGIVLKPDRSKPYPTVAEVSPNGVVARESQRNPVCSGDLLLSINHMDVSAMGYRQSLEIMKFAPRPLVLTFRRSSPEYPVVRSLEL